jgi:hypothetical protein
VSGTLFAALSLFACVPRGVSQSERDDKREQTLNRRRQPLDHTQAPPPSRAATSSQKDSPAKITVTVTQP